MDRRAFLSSAGLGLGFVLPTASPDAWAQSNPPIVLPAPVLSMVGWGMELWCALEGGQVVSVDRYGRVYHRAVLPGVSQLAVFGDRLMAATGTLVYEWRSR